MGMDTSTQTTATTPNADPPCSGAGVGSPLPADFDLDEWTRHVCERSGVPVAVTDPVALGKLRTLTTSTDH